MDTSEELKSLLANMRMMQGFQNIAKNAMVELPICKFPSRTWDLVNHLQMRAYDDIENQINRVIGKPEGTSTRKADALSETEPTQNRALEKGVTNG